MKRMIDNVEKLEKISDYFVLYEDGSIPDWTEGLEVYGEVLFDSNVEFSGNVALHGSVFSDNTFMVDNVITGADFSVNSFNLFTLANNASIVKIYDDASGNSFCSVKAVGMTPNNFLLETISKILSQKDVSIKVIFVLDGISYSVENITMKVNDTDSSKYDMIGTTMLMKGISEPLNNVELKMRPSHYYYE